MVEREITDIVQVTLSIFLASIYLFSKEYSYSSNQLSIISLILLAVIAFVHNTFTQLRMMTSNLSKITAGFSVIILMFSFIGLYQKQPDDWDAFWKNLGLSIGVILFIGYSVLTIAIVLSVRADGRFIDKK